MGIIATGECVVAIPNRDNCRTRKGVVATVAVPNGDNLQRESFGKALEEGMVAVAVWWPRL